jgi:squalene-hopene/tetraprenyl-beta-curcumene cyclase
LTFIE